MLTLGAFTRTPAAWLRYGVLVLVLVARHALSGIAGPSGEALGSFSNFSSDLNATDFCSTSVYVVVL